MASYLWSSSNITEFDTLLEKITSSNLPSSSLIDLNLSLNLTDLIRSNSISSEESKKSFIKRLKNNNPNVLLFTLELLDISIKNGGNSFLLSIGMEDFTKLLVKLVKGESIVDSPLIGSNNNTTGGVINNREVMEKASKKLQDWALAFKSKRSLEYLPLVNAYANLKANGYPFPPVDQIVTAAFVDSLSAPEWTDSAYCTRCRNPFSTFNRKHHCRNCGSVFDQVCSSQSVPLPHYGIIQPVRVCDGCIKKIKEGNPTTGLVRSVSLGNLGSAFREDGGRVERSTTVSYGSGSNRSRNYRSSSGSKASSSSAARSKEEEDFQKAIAASLQDSSNPPDVPRSNSKPVPYSSSHSKSTASTNNTKSTRTASEEEDPELAAAIAASLRDLTPAASAPSETYASLYPSSQSQSSYNNNYSSNSNTNSNPYYPSITPKPTSYSSHQFNSYDLSPTEQSSLEAFSTLPSLSPYASQDQNYPPPILGAKERDLYDRVKLVQPRLERGLEDTERRKEILVEMNLKLVEATRLYEGLLDERVRVGANARSAYPQQVYQSPVVSQQYQQAYQSQQIYQPQQPQQAYASPPPPPQQPNQNYQYLTQNYPTPTPNLQDPYPQQPQQYAQAPPPPPPTFPQQPQPHPQQPAGYYTPASFPSLPSNLEQDPNIAFNSKQVTSFPSVPVVNPWDSSAREGEVGREREGEKVGELIEL